MASKKSKLLREFEQAHHHFGGPTVASWTSVSGSTSTNSDPHITSTPLPMAVSPPAKRPRLSEVTRDANEMAPFTNTPNDLSEDYDSFNIDEAESYPTSGPGLKAKPHVRFNNWALASV